MNLPLKITIITAVYNGEAYLEETIKSVLGQSYTDIEYIIVDGLSEDRTPEIIDAYRSRISHIIAEADHSMYEAINRGIKAATGDFLLVLNSDDCLADKNVIHQVVRFVEKHPGCLAYYGNILKREGERMSKRRVFQIDRKHLLYTKHSTLVPHPALFVNRIQSLNKIGVYDLTYRYASDFDYILRLMDKGIVKYMDIYVSIFRIHDESITSSGKLDKERVDILNRYENRKSWFVKSFYYFLIWAGYKILNVVANRK